jgi:hypothetical protein
MGVFYPTYPIGGRSGNPYRFVGGTDGKLLQRIGVWAGHAQINGLRVWLGDDQPITLGLTWGSYKEFEFQTGERITALSLWRNGNNTRVTAIHFRTSLEKEFDHVMTEHSRAQEYPIDVGSGICVGVAGTVDYGIYSMAFVFLEQVACARLRNVSYPTLSADAAPITPVKLEQFRDHNRTDNPRSWSFSGSHKIATSSSWSVTVGVAVHAEMSIEASIPEVAKVGTKFGWTLSLSATHGTSRTEESSLNWQESGTLEPGDSIDVTALTRMGHVSVPYTGEMEVTLKSGETFSYPIKGHYTGVSYADVEIVDSGVATALKAVAATV